MRYLFILFSAALLFSSCVKDRVIPTPTVVIPVGGTLIHYWNFNGSSTTIPSYTIGSGNLSFDFTTVPDTTSTITGYADLLSPVVPTTNINAQNGDIAGNALRVRNPCTDFIITAPTTGYKNIVLSYSVARSNNGAVTNTVYYTTDGVNYINTGLPTVSYSVNIDPAYALETFDFSAITAVNNNANFKFKIVFSNGNLATSGNDRFDNITVDGVSISGTSGGGVPAITSGSTASGIVGTVFTNYTIIASNTPTSYDVTNLPPGLTMDTTTGVISGTPTSPGTFVDTLKATNSKGTGTQVLTITINPPASIALLHYWNFNDITSLTTLITPTVSKILGDSLHFDFTTVSSTTGYYDSVTSTANLQNEQNGDPDGDALRVRNPSLDMIISAPTTGYKDIVISYAVDASSTTSGALTNNISYTTDGVNYITTGLASVSYTLNSFIDPTYALATFDFSSIPAVNNNPNFKVMITFSNGNLNTKGNDRFDNITVEGYPQ